MNDRILPEDEKLQIRKALSQVQDELAALDLEIAHIKATYTALLTKREEHISRMERLQAMVALQKTLPDEILAEIFAFAASSEGAVCVPPLRRYRGMCPWTLTHVCSRWRIVALNEPRLWTCVQLSDVRTGFGSNPKLMPAAEEVIRRGGHLLLHLSVFERISAKLFLSIITPHLNRIKTLRLDVSPSFITHFLSLSPELCVLEEININTPHIGLPPTSCRIFERARSLCRFTLGCPSHLVCALHFPPYFCFPWNQLTSLVFEQVSFDRSTFHEVLAQCSRLVTLVARITVIDLNAEDFDANDTILLPSLESLELHLRSKGQRALHPLIVPALSVLSLETQNLGADDLNLSSVADMLRRSSSPLVDLQLNAVEDIGPILECCPKLLNLYLPLRYLGLSIIKNMTSGEWVPNIQALGCRIHHHLVDAFLDMLEIKWEGEIGLPEADRRLMSDVRFCVDGPDEAELVFDNPNHPLNSRLNRIQERLGRRRVEFSWINEGTSDL